MNHEAQLSIQRIVTDQVHGLQASAALATDRADPEVEETAVLEQLRVALVGHGFVLYAQPIMPLRARDPARHLEVLLRLAGDDGAVVPPSRFLPVAERHGLMPRIDRWVARHALVWWAGQQSRPAGPGCLAINLSAQSLADDEFLDDLRNEFELLEVDPATLIFEITETQVIADLERASRLLETLRRQGCRTALDDFGTGHCPFRYLKELPVDFLKIAGNFVRAMDDDPIDVTLVGAMTALGRKLGIRTVAECVETPAALESVCGLGMDFAQGHGIAAPCPLTQVLPA